MADTTGAMHSTARCTQPPAALDRLKFEIALGE